MIYLVIGMVLSICATAALFIFFDCADSDGCLLVGIIFSIISMGFILVVSIGGFCWKTAEVKANIINREYGTNYTKQEIFYAEDVIDTIREIDRERIEVNGNLIKGD